jgi:uroporphyrinogen-III synthase
MTTATVAPSLRGTRIAVLESRMGTELASLVERCSGVPYCVPITRGIERGHGQKRECELPEDLAPLLRLVDEIIERRVGAVAFTSPTQVRNLVAISDRAKKTKELLVALRTHTLVAAIGPTCAEALRTLGIPPRVVPESPKMGPLVQSIARFLTEARS